MNVTDYRKLVFSINEIDPITGVYYFNGCSKTYYVEEEGELGYPKECQLLNGNTGLTLIVLYLIG